MYVSAAQTYVIPLATNKQTLKCSTVSEKKALKVVMAVFSG